ncbi:MAG: DUF1816 domain-containing protein [Coleofasciculaceae cyanobacterium]
MTLLDNTEDFFAYLLKRIGMAFWLEIITDNPKCIYYFGPFLSAKEAALAQAGYLEDLEEEKAQIISVETKRCQPDNLTVCDDELADYWQNSISPSISRFVQFD